MGRLMRVMIMGLLVLLSACAPFWGDEEVTGTRRLAIYHRYTDDRASDVYLKNGDYDKAALKRLNAVMRDRTSGEVGEIDPKLYTFIADVRAALKLPAGKPIEIVSGFRSPARNKKLAAQDHAIARDSLHTKGQAVDIRIPGVDPGRIAAVASGLKRGGVALYPSSGHVHLDVGSPRTWTGK